MKISGFTMGKNAGKLYYPMKESILSLLPLVDEFIVGLGDSDPDDSTRQQILSINSPKIKIVDTVWDIEAYPRGMEMAHQTDIAKSYCTGDWLFYIQADEVLHEKYLPVIEQRCRELLDDHEVEGLLFDYKHFWGDYDHYFDGYGWYPREIRIIRNDKDIHSWRDAQSFRRIPDFDGKSYRQEKNTFKLKVARVDACIFHYGWVRPPGILKSKIREFRILQRGRSTVEAQAQTMKNYYSFDYGVLNKVPVYKETHPAVLREWISRFNWADQLQYSGKRNPERRTHKHEKFKYRAKTFIEKKLLFGYSLGGFRNYILLKK
jgi:hypothetical protein